MALDHLVRVKLKNGSETSLGEGFAKSHDLEVLDKPAVRNGRAVPAKPKVSVATRATESKKPNPAGSDTSASSKEESK